MFKARVIQRHPSLTDRDLLRFLRAREFEIEKSIKLLEDAQVRGRVQGGAFF